jgi:hypothetical protein
MTRQDGPVGVQPKHSEHEIFASLRLAGVEGRLKAVLDENHLLLERRDGKGLRISLSSIQRVRHHHAPIVPPGITWMGVILLLFAIRVLEGTIQLYALSIGAITLFTWLLGRRPTLYIDTEAGDRHLLHGRDSTLLRLQMMVNRLCDGKTLEEARIGLEDLTREANFPTVNPLQSLHMEADSLHEEELVEAELMQEDVFDDVDLESALSRMYRGESATVPEPKPANSYTTSGVQSATGGLTTQSSEDQGGRGLLERASATLSEERSENPVWNGWQQGQTRFTPTTDTQNEPWSQTPATQPVQKDPWSTESDPWARAEPEVAGTRIQSALNEAKEAGSGLFSSSAFDDSAPSEGGIFGNLFDDTPASSFSPPQEEPRSAYERTWGREETPSWYEEKPAPSRVDPWQQQPVSSDSLVPVQQPTQSPPTGLWSGAALRQAMDGGGLPEPSAGALRQECAPGVVARARMQNAARTHTTAELPMPLEAIPAEDNAEALEDYPALTRMLQTSPKPRLRAAERPHERGALSNLARRGWSALSGIRQSKPIIAIAARARTAVPARARTDADDYSSVYGDEDGFGDGLYREVPLRSGQILRLRADHDHQADLAERIKHLSKSTGGGIAEGEATDIVQRLADSGDLAPIAAILAAAETKSRESLTFSAMKSTSPKRTPEGHHGISRLG